MFTHYHLTVIQNSLRPAQTKQEHLAQDLDRCMRCPYTKHLVLGRNGGDEVLFVGCQQTPSDGRAALFEASEFYAYRTGYWPDFFSFECEIREIQAHGDALPTCLGFAKHRQMIVLTKSDMDSHERLMAPRKVEPESSKPRESAGLPNVAAENVVAQNVSVQNVSVQNVSVQNVSVQNVVA